MSVDVSDRLRVGDRVTWPNFSRRKIWTVIQVSVNGCEARITGDFYQYRPLLRVDSLRMTVAGRLLNVRRRRRLIPGAAGAR